MLPQSLETQSLSVAKWKPQITDLSLEIGWERDSWIPHIMPPGLYYVIFTCFETWWKHIMWYSITWYLPVSKLDESILCCNSITWYLPVSKLDESILCDTVLRDIYLFRNLMKAYYAVIVLRDIYLFRNLMKAYYVVPVLRDIYLFRNLMKAYYVIQYYVIYTCFETWWKHIML